MHKYYHEIDALRAIAVIAVILNHLNASWLPSGFLGVDIFFVISGFVVTASLQGKKEESFKKYISNFYKKRFKRLYPALILTLFVTVVLSFALIPSPAQSIKTGFFSLFGVSNIFLLNSSSDYFSENAELNPFTHTWSLGVEEQFYVIFPLIFFFLSKKIFIKTIVILSLISVGAFVFYFPTSPMSSFYLMPMRFWQLAMGSLIFYSPQIPTFAKRNLFILILCILLVGTLFNGSGFNPLTAATVSFLTALLLAFIKSSSPRDSFLTTPLLVKTGMLSYSLYLVHWPLIVLVKNTISLDFPFIIVALTLGMTSIAFLSYKFVESKLRSICWNNSQRLLFGFLFVFIFFSKSNHKTLSHSLFLGTPAESYGTSLNPIIDKKIAQCFIDSKRELKTDKSFSDFLLNECQLTSFENAQSMYVFGNSYVEEKIPLLVKLAQKQQLNLFYFGRAGMPVTTTYSKDLVDNSLSSEYLNQFLETVKTLAKRGDKIILSSPLSYFLQDDLFLDQNENALTGEQAFNIFKHALEKMTSDLKKKGLKVFFIGGYPVLRDEINPHFCYQPWSQFNQNCIIANAYSSEKNHKILAMDTLLATDPMVNYISLFQVFDELTTALPYPMRLYHNKNHLSVFANEALFPYLENQLN